MAYDDLRSLWLSSNLRASECKFFSIWPSNTSQSKLVSVLFSFVRACTEMALMLLALKLRLPASLFGHPLQVCVRKFTFPNLHWLAIPCGQGLRILQVVFKEVSWTSGLYSGTVCQSSGPVHAIILCCFLKLETLFHFVFLYPRPWLCVFLIQELCWLEP